MKVLMCAVFLLCLAAVLDLAECRRPRKQRRRRPKILQELEHVEEDYDSVQSDPYPTGEAPVVPVVMQGLTATSPSPPPTTFAAARACHRVCEGSNSFLREDLCDCDCDEPGFAYNEQAGKCKDIDECEDESNCQGGTCANLKGSYQCNCPVGYNLHANGKLCLPEPQVIPCRGLLCLDGASLDEDNCQCKCGHRGLVYDYFKEGCTGDIDECTLGIDGCRHSCVNTMGSYSCHCYEGFRLNYDGQSCDPIDPDCRDASFCAMMASAIECLYNPNIRSMCPKSCRVCRG